MATQSVQKDFSGPDWPCGLIAVATAGTPVGIMSLVDSANVNDPATITPGTSGANEYTQRCNQIVFYGVKAGASHGLQPNTGNVYVMRKSVQGAGNRDDFGSCVAIIFPGQAYTLVPSALTRNGFSPYRYYIDADNNGDSALVTLIIQ